MNWSDLPPLSALRAFAAYAQTGSVTKAAAALNVSHPAISQQLRGLETHLGVALLDRTGRGMQLTTQGQQLATALETGFGGIAAVVAALTGADAARPLNISVTPGFAAGWLMPRLAGFRSANPDIGVMIDPTPQLCDPAPGGIDVAIRYGQGAWPGMEVEPLVAAPLVLVAAPSLVGDGPAPDPAEMVNLPWLQELGTNETTRWLTERGVDTPHLPGLLQVPGNLMLDGARSGQGIAVTTRLFVEEDIRAGRLRVLFQDDKPHGYHLVLAPGVMRPPLRAFVQWIRRQAG